MKSSSARGKAPAVRLLQRAQEAAVPAGLLHRPAGVLYQPLDIGLLHHAGECRLGAAALQPIAANDLNMHRVVLAAPIDAAMFLEDRVYLLKTESTRTPTTRCLLALTSNNWTMLSSYIIRQKNGVLRHRRRAQLVREWTTLMDEEKGRGRARCHTPAHTCGSFGYRAEESQEDRGWFRWMTEFESTCFTLYICLGVSALRMRHRRQTR